MTNLLIATVLFQTAGAQNPLMGLLPIVAFFVVFYLILIVPQKKQRKKHSSMLEALKPGDRVLTNAGIYGTIAKIEENKAVIRVADGVKMEFVKSMIAGLASDPAAEQEIPKN